MCDYNVSCSVLSFLAEQGNPVCRLFTAAINGQRSSYLQTPLSPQWAYFYVRDKTFMHVIGEIKGVGRGILTFAVCLLMESPFTYGVGNPNVLSMIACAPTGGVAPVG